MLIIGLASCGKDLVAPSPSLTERLQGVLDDTVGLPDYRKGISVAIVGPGDQVWHGVSGVSDPVTAEAISEDMLFNIGWSVSEMYIAALILHYAADGLLSLDDPISEWLKDFAHIEEDSITVRHLLTHTSGLYDYLLNPNIPTANYYTMNHSTVWDFDRLLDSYLLNPLAVPGSQWYASNTDYLILREIIDVISESARVQSIHDRLLDPLNLTHTFLDHFEDIPAGASIAHGWFWCSDGSDLFDITPDPRTAIATAVPTSIFSTAEELARFTKALLTGVLLDQAEMEALLAFEATGQSDGSEYGLGIFQRSYQGYEYWGKGGWDYGYESQVLYIPDLDICVALLMNYHSWTSHFLYLLLDILLEEYA